MLVHTQDSHWSLGFPANFLLSDFKHLMTDVWILESYEQKSVIILHPEGQVDYMFSGKYFSGGRAYFAEQTTSTILVIPKL